MNQKSVQNEIQSVLGELSQAFPIAKEPNVRDQLSSEIETEQFRIDRRLRRDNPFRESQSVLQHTESELARNIAAIDRLESDFQHFQALAKQTNSRIDEAYWLAEFKKLKERQEYHAKLRALAERHGSNNRNDRDRDPNRAHEEQFICRTLLLQRWRKLLDEQFAKWEIETIQKYRQKLLDRLGEWLEKLQLLADTLDELSIEPGLLFDLSKDNLTLSDIEQLKKWVSYISRDEGVKALCDLMGRLRRAEQTKRQELVKTVSTVTEYVPDINSKEEIVGIYLGKDIEHALPQEIALLADDETAVLFDMKFVEGRLMCFEMEGMQARSHDVEEEIVIEVEEEDKLGPIIICVDTSGSMAGMPETIAKAVTLFIATRAISQKRNCFLINFSTGIETLDLSGQIGMGEVIAFLQRSFHGGTDVGPALTHALQMMTEKNYEQSDLLIISDFIMGSLPESQYQKISNAKANKNRFYSLSIGDLFLSKRLREVFDDEWVYNPSTSSIRSLQNVASAIS